MAGRPPASPRGRAIPVNVRLPPETRDALREAAARHGVSQAGAVALALDALRERDAAD